MNAGTGHLGYWHPALPGRRISRGETAAVKIAGQSIAVFRAANGSLGAVTDQCAHRRMRLSLGQVRQERLVCPYHGWSFDREGRGESPVAPKLHACIASYDCSEASDVIWLKERGSARTLPEPAMPGYDFAGVVFNRIRAPLELVIDNFGEVEHTLTTHAHFGFDPDQVEHAVVEVESGEDFVAVRNRGPAKIPPFDTRVAIALRRGDWFHSDYTFRFDPPRSSVTHFWTDPQTGAERMLSYHLFHYFVPEDTAITNIVTFSFLKMKWPLIRYLGSPLHWLFQHKVRQTVEEDAFLLENLANKSTAIEGMKLSRFDSVLRLTRERLERIYYNRPA